MNVFFLKFISIDQELEETKDSFERIRERCDNQRTDIFKLEDERLKIFKEKEQMKVQLDKLAEKLENANENYNQLKIMIGKAAQDSDEKSKKSEKNNINAEEGNENQIVEEEKEISALKMLLMEKEQEISRLRFENSVTNFIYSLNFSNIINKKESFETIARIAKR